MSAFGDDLILWVDRDGGGHVPAQPRITLIQRDHHGVNDVALCIFAVAADALHGAAQLQVGNGVDLHGGCVAGGDVHHLQFGQVFGFDLPPAPIAKAHRRCFRAGREHFAGLEIK